MDTGLSATSVPEPVALPTSPTCGCAMSLSFSSNHRIIISIVNAPCHSHSPPKICRLAGLQLKIFSYERCRKFGHFINTLCISNHKNHTFIQSQLGRVHQIKVGNFFRTRKGKNNGARPLTRRSRAGDVNEGDHPVEQLLGLATGGRLGPPRLSPAPPPTRRPSPRC